MLLEDALKNDIIKVATIDVCEVEPLETNCPLWNINNSIITPHVVGGYHLEETMDKIVEIAIRNLNELKNVEEFINIVNRKIGYKQI